MAWEQHYIGQAGQPAFGGDWSNYGADQTGTYQEAGFAKDGPGVVHLFGLVKSTTAPPDTIFILPAGFRPIQRLVFLVLVNNRVGRVDVFPHTDPTFPGCVTYVSGPPESPLMVPDFLALDGITFLARA